MALELNLLVPIINIIYEYCDNETRKNLRETLGGIGKCIEPFITLDILIDTIGVMTKKHLKFISTCYGRDNHKKKMRGWGNYFKKIACIIFQEKDDGTFGQSNYDTKETKLLPRPNIMHRFWLNEWIGYEKYIP